MAYEVLTDRFTAVNGSQWKEHVNGETITSANYNRVNTEVSEIEDAALCMVLSPKVPLVSVYKTAVITVSSDSATAGFTNSTAGVAPVTLAYGGFSPAFTADELALFGGNPLHPDHFFICGLRYKGENSDRQTTYSLDAFLSHHLNGSVYDLIVHPYNPESFSGGGSVRVAAGQYVLSLLIFRPDTQDDVVSA